jgi:hypothetical protein
MADEEIHYSDGRMEHPAVRYEPRDIHFRWILLAIVIACGVASLHYYVVLRLFWLQEQREKEEKRSPFPLAATPSTKLPAEPRLEQINRMAAAETANVAAREAAQEKTLNTYGPTPEQGFVHVPIGQAMKLVAKELSAKEELPPRPKKDNGLLDAGESNSGRMFRAER